MKSSPVYSFWISGPLHRVNHLTAASFKEHGHRLIVYSYTDIKIDAEVRDAREMMPESELYRYTHLPTAFQLGGAAERLKANMILKLGGLHVDLDVTALQPLNLDQPYIFRPHPDGIVANIIKVPEPNTLFAELYREDQQAIDADNRDFSASFRPLAHIVQKLQLGQYIVRPDILGMDVLTDIVVYLNNNSLRPPVQQMAVHWCAAMNLLDKAQPCSFFDKLCRYYNL